MKKVSCTSLKKKSVLCILFIIAFASFSCDITSFRHAKICVLSDIHYFNPELLVADGSAFQTYLAGDRKLLKESGAILESALAMVAEENPDILLIPGDMTKDGELIGHEKVSQYLRGLEKKGTRVYVVPGNHDINNPHAMSFNGDTTAPVEQVTPEMFSAIYKHAGFRGAIARDRNSLSYIVEPVRGLWIFMLDSCKYKENNSLGSPVTSGSFSSETMEWIRKYLEKAARKKNMVFGVMHHGILEHYRGQKLIFPEYIVDDNDSISGELADLGMKAVFTGHYHAQDITKKVTASGNFLFDIETGSLVTYPCPYRVIELDDDMLTITSKRIAAIDYDLGGLDFQAYALSYLTSGLHDLVVYMLTTGAISVGGYPVIVPLADALQIAPLMTQAFAAHYAGDESPDQMTLMIIQGLLSDTDPVKRLMGSVLAGLWTDLDPGDNTITIDLGTGEMIQ